MKKIVVVTIGLMLLSTQALAFDLIGPPKSGFTGAGQSGVGIEYAWSKLDIEADSIPELDLLSATIKDVQIDKISTNLGLGMGEGSELFFRLGVAKAEPDKGDNVNNVAGYIGDSDECFLLGGGAKFTVIKGEYIDWGLIIQTAWTKFEFDEKSYSIAGYNVVFDTDADIFETQLAAGATWKATENIALYGGPFFHWIRGDAELKGTIDGVASRVITDLEEDSVFGGFAGTQISIEKNTTFNIEFQVTEAGNGFGISLGHRF